MPRQIYDFSALDVLIVDDSDHMLAIIAESERAFVRSDVYVGPDRRSRRKENVTRERRTVGFSAAGAPAA